jgi:uncharacterized protein YacL (UPF0231 family)
MRKLLLLLFVLMLPFAANAQDEEVYPELKMKIVVQEVLNAFKMSSVSTSTIGKHISNEWLQDNEIQLANYKINSYSPEEYNIVAIYDRYVIATVGGQDWEHMLIFKFINEDGVYRLIPKGFSPAGNDYIDPWYAVTEYTRRDF